ncbi:ABC transporter ATP-binding protein/permease [Desulfogranum japonicum]|uniref:ABC transporter ATP-binding protein/permease n=1 Tax=Desulfogranum japonicum TaxID=231447 RepID=UPI000417757A|nr:ABC transporter ATP-binding protein/permease [Desulfogranum japonicum]
MSSAEKRKVTKRSLFSWVLYRHRGLQLLLLLIIGVSLFCRVFPLEMQKRIINQAIYLKKVDLLFLYCGLYMGAVLLAGITKYIINVMQAAIGQKILVEMRTELYRHVLQLPLQFYRRMQPGTVISAMTSELNAIGTFIGGAITIPLTSVLSFLVFLGYMFSLSPLLALLSMVVYPLELITVPILQNKYNISNRKRIKTTRSMSNVVNEAINGLHEIHSNASFPLEENKFGTLTQKLYRIINRLNLVKYGIKFTNNLFQSIGPFILFLIGGYLAIQGEFTLGALIAFLTAYEKVYDPWKELIEYYQSLQDTRVRYRQIMRIFDQDLEYPMFPGDRPPLSLAGNIRTKNAGFTVDDGLSLLNDINLDIRPGELIALVGFSGSGKSTLALLLAQLYSINRGYIFLDDVDITTLTKSDISSNITMIAQHPFIFTGTIRENLLYGVHASGEQDVTPSRKKLLQTIYDVGLKDDILHFGFNMVLPPERVQPIKSHLMRMRQIINRELKNEFSKVIEPYTLDSFLYYSSIRDNLIFGDSLSGKYTTENLATNSEFRYLTEANKLYQRLIDLGLTIAQATVTMLRDVGDDDFFFQGSPMEPRELEYFQDMLNSSKGKVPSSKNAQNDLLCLALRFIPGRHKITTISHDLQVDIVQARHTFLHDIVHLDFKACRSASEHLSNDTTLQPLPIYQNHPDFIAYCPSQYLYSHSLKDNILFGAVKKELQEHQDVLDLSLRFFEQEGLVDEILDVGLDFEVGSQGDRLSGGQKQKVAIARAFLKDTQIMILDEATASLDNSSQRRIQNVLERQFRGKKTVISVIHRLDLAPGYDKIYVLKSGSVIEQGTYDELMAKQGAFYELTRAQ